MDEEDRISIVEYANYMVQRQSQWF